MRFFFTIQILLIAITGYSQVLTGKVIDIQNQAVEFATVALYTLPDSTLVKGTITNQQGEFSLAHNGTENYFLKISFIGYETLTVSAISGQTIVLNKDSKVLNEVVIQGHRKTFQIQNGNLVANVSGTILGKEVNATEMLRKIPGMTLKNGELTSFIGGAPVIYINGKKAQSMSEVQQLEVKNIKSAELNTNPGAEYDASTGAVLSITTHRQIDGLAVQVENYARLNSYFTHDNTLKINYKKNKISVFGQAEYSDYRKKASQDLTTIVHAPDTIWHSDMPMRELSRSSKTFEYVIGSNYDFFNNHNIGIKYDGSFNKFNLATAQPLTMLANNVIFTKIDGHSDKSDQSNRHYINGYYHGYLTEKLQMKLYADWLKRSSNANQIVVEKSAESGNSITEITSKTDNSLFGITPKFSYNINKQHILRAGADFNSVEVHTLLNYEPKIFIDTRSKTAETKLAGYLNYSYNNESGFSFSTGLRYEYVNTLCSDFNNNNLHRVYSNLFPNAQVSYRKRLTSQSISYRSGITRPSFNTISGGTYYGNRFVYQEGNPKLEPEILHNVQYNFMYRFIYFSLRYNYTNNSIQMEYQTPYPTSNIIKGTWANYKNQQQLQAVLNLRHTFKFYTPSITLSYTQSFLDVPVYNTVERINKPFGHFDFSNDFDFKNGLLFNVEYSYNGGGTFGALYVGETHVFSARVQKMFFKNRLQTSLKVNDIFGKSVIHLKGQIYHIHMSNVDYQDSRSVVLSLIWRFNNYKKIYKGQSASQDMINRL
ncbi:MAG TPA: TonB-dependent receptor [Salinivirgaceae bacterium]|nr:TonB-dependent receptor [Salinivirgaceae bacterium]